MRTFIASTVAATALVAGAAGLVAPAAQARTAHADTVPSCSGALIHVGHNRPQGATGHANVVLRFRNISQSTCSLRGYPGVDALGARGRVLAHARRTLNGFTGGAHAVRTIVLAPNHVASADLEWHNFDFATGGTCRFSASIAVTPPNTSATVHFPVSVSVCGLQIHPTVAGATGND